jgi:hypothetical protein
MTATSHSSESRHRNCRFCGSGYFLDRVRAEVPGPNGVEVCVTCEMAYMSKEAAEALLILRAAHLKGTRQENHRQHGEEKE